MTYVSWAALYEGGMDEAYFELLIPRIMEDILRHHGTRNSTIPPAPAVRLHRDTVEKVAREACAARDAFHLVFIHADTGGRAMEVDLSDRSMRYCEAMHAVCRLPLARCVVIAPRHETEAWVLADPNAVTAAFGYTGSVDSLGLPASAADAERLDDPKATLAAAMTRVRGRRRRPDIRQIVPAIAQRQSLDTLRQTRSFATFEASLRIALSDLGCV